MRTSLLKMIRRKKKQQNKPAESGFTLFEILIVLGVIAAVLVVAVPKLTSTTSKVQSTIRRLSTLCREMHNAARLKQQNYRLVIKMDTKQSSYWIESGSMNSVPLTEDQLKNMESMNDEQKKAILERSQFSQDKSILKGEQILPKPLKFLQVEYAGREKAITEGTTYVYFFGQGLAQEAAIHIGDGEKLHWTLAIRPLTGKTDILQRDVKLQELQ